jgi:nicotinamidase-related amidase
MTPIRLQGRHYRTYPAEGYLGHQEVPIELDPATTAFLIVDVYGQFAEAGGTEQTGLEYMFGNEWDIVANRIRPAKDAAKRLGIPCVYATNSAPRIELQRSAFGIQREENVGQTLEELFAESVNDPLEYVAGKSTYIEHADVIAPQPDDYYIRKYVYSGFWDTRLDSLLRNLGVRTLVCAGFAADICLLGTMIDALYRNYKIVLLRDATQAVEIPEFDGTDGAFTRRIVLWTECHLGHTCTSADWVAACESAEPGR